MSAYTIIPPPPPPVAPFAAPPQRPRTAVRDIPASVSGRKSVARVDVVLDGEFWCEGGKGRLISYKDGLQPVEFRVDRTLLEKHSATFASDVKKHWQNPPIKYTSQTAEDVRHLFRALRSKDETGSFFTPHTTFHAVAACIRLGLEFMCVELYNTAMAKVKTYFTDDFKIVRSRRTRPLPVPIPPEFGGLDIAIPVINLARLTNTPSLLPLAFIACTKLNDLKPLTHGFRRDDGTRERLSPEDLGIVMRACRALHTSFSACIVEIYESEVSDECVALNGDACKAALRRICGKWLYNFGRASTPPLDPFCMHWKEPLMKTEGSRLCHLCTYMVVERGTVTDEVNWKELPCILGIKVPGWSTCVCPVHSPEVESFMEVDIEACILKDKMPWSSTYQ